MHSRNYQISNSIKKRQKEKKINFEEINLLLTSSILKKLSPSFKNIRLWDTIYIRKISCILYLYLYFNELWQMCAPAQPSSQSRHRTIPQMLPPFVILIQTFHSRCYLIPFLSCTSYWLLTQALPLLLLKYSVIFIQPSNTFLNESCNLCSLVFTGAL